MIWAIRRRVIWQVPARAIAARQKGATHDDTQPERDQGDGRRRGRSRRQRCRHARRHVHRARLRGLCAGCRHRSVRSRARKFPAGAGKEGFAMTTDPALMSLTEVARAIAGKRLSSHEVTRSCLHRIAEWQPRLNAFMAVEAEAALKAAGEAAAEIAKGKSRGPLHGG